MSNRKIITAAAATGGTGNYSSVAVSDPYYDNVVLLLNGEQEFDNNFANVSLLLTGDDFTDKSSSPKTTTRDSTFVVSSTHKKYGSGAFTRTSGGTLSIANDASLSFGSGDFTAEFWYKQITAGETGIIGKWNSASGASPDWSEWLFLSYGTTVEFWVSDLSGAYSALLISTTTDFSTWKHVAVSRSGSTWKLFVNGVAEATVTSTKIIQTGTVPFRIGCWSTGGTGGNFSIDDIRITKGIARYTANFTPPVNALPTNKILDSSVYRLPITTTGNVKIDTSTKKYGAGSMFFNGITGGTNAYILLNNSNFALNTISFTIEGWFNCNVPSGSSGVVFALSTGYTGSTGISLFINSQLLLTFWYNGTNLNASSTISFNTWYHFAYVKNGSNILCFLNGTLLATTTNSFAQTTNNLTIGSTLGGTTWDATYTAPMYIDDFRITNGIARYTAAFTPPSASLPTIPSTISSDPWWNDVVLLIDGNTTDAYDPYWQNTSLMLTGDDFIDWSNQHNAVTLFGNTAINTTTKKFGIGSMYFDGSGDYLTLPYSTDFQFSGDFTIESWINPDASQLVSIPCVFGNYSTYAANGGIALLLNHPDTPNKYGLVLNGTYPAIVSSSNVITNAWTHIAIVRSGSIVTLYVNGSLIGSATYSGTVQGTQNYWWVGASGDYIGTTTYKGYIDDLRITKGIARYTANFTPPTAALPAYKIQDRTQNNLTLTPYGNVQLSTDVFKNGAGSMFFDGTGDSVVMGDSSQFTFGTGDFTIEAWVYITRVWGTHAIVSQRSDLQNELFFGFDPVNGCTLFMYCDGVSGISGGRYPHPTPVTLNAWHHVVAMRRSGVAYISLDGNIQVGVSFTRNLTSTHCCIGSDSVLSGTGVFSGYIDDLRITKGYTRYTQNFTPPSQSFATQYTSTVYDANYANVSLLLNGNGTNGSQVFTDSSSSPNIITAYGNAQISTSVKKFSTGSMYFDGNGDVLKTPPASAFTFGTGDFTVEGWFYQTTDNTYPSAFEINNHLGVGGILFITRYNGTACIYAADTGGGSFIAPQATTLNTWNHIAWVRNNSVLRTYVNGVSSSSNALTLNITATTSVTIGGEQSVTTGYCFPGYIDDFRVTKGIARYVTNFTPQNY